MRKFGTAAVLAGGRSRRMGFDKQLLKIGDQRLIATLLPKLQECFDDIIVITAHAELYEDMPVRTYTDSIPGMGPLSGIYTALPVSTSEYIYVMACDMPHFDAAYCLYMREQLNECPADACVTQIGDWLEPFHAYYGRGLIPKIRESLDSGETSMHRFLARSDTLYIPEREARRYTRDWSLFINLNTREKYDIYLHGIRSRL